MNDEDRSADADPEAAAALARRIGRAEDPATLAELIGRRELALGRSPTAVAEEFGWPVETVERWAATQQAETDGVTRQESATGARQWLTGTTIRTAAIVALLAVLLLVFLQPGLLLGARAGAVAFYADAVGPQHPEAADEPLQLSAADAAYLNRIFEEQDTEVGYCGLIDDDRQLRPWLATLGDSAVTSVELSVRNCPTGAYPMLALLHTHPNGDPRLTPADRRALEVADVDFLCIQHGRVEAMAGEPTQRLRCYASPDDREDGPRTPARVPVIVGS